ncbi:MAG: signal peptide peptidase SppA [Thalassotalea sp.]|nr:signal peptide peptidase SppA [Thalassotalea sp.]
MNNQPGIIRRFFSFCWRFLDFSRRFLLNLIFIGIIVSVIARVSSDEAPVLVPNKTALVLDLRGDIVEQKIEIDPFDALLNEAYGVQEEKPEVLLANVLEVIDSAQQDDRIEVIVLKLDQLRSAGLSKLQDIGKALVEFKVSGKKIIAVGEYYSQGQYYLASYADEVWLAPNGYLLLEGFGRYQLYFKSALEKLSVSSHIFRVGTYKSAVEPYIRDDMSDAAKVANSLWLNDLWKEYKTGVAAQRGFDVSNFDENVESLITKFNDAGGSFADYAIQNQWVDKLVTRNDMRQELIELVGKNTSGESFSQINYKNYLKATSSALTEYSDDDKVAIVVAKGVILNGTQKPGTIGGESTAYLLRQARFNDDVKAVVLRVDSPGGSAFASEVIRQEIELIQAAGKPVVASMGTMAASGGYWISASADKIIASPTTITGSIGIFGMLMTLENTLGDLGIYTDGVGTTDFSGFSVTRPLSDGMSQLMQLSINRGYQDFLELVAEGRNMTVQQVDKVAQGRVWSGSKAKELGLVDELGSLDKAIEVAAELAQLETYDSLLIEKKQSPTHEFWQGLLDSSISLLAPKALDDSLDNIEIKTQGPIAQLLGHIKTQLKTLDNFNDPKGIYSFCLTCEIN